MLNQPAEDPDRTPRSTSFTRSTRMAVARIAIADDDPDSLDLICSALRSPTNEIHQATTGAELVVLLADQGPFDLVVTDVSMPWMEGLHVLESARAAHVDTPVIVVTGLSRANLEAKISRLGNARLLRKPFVIDDLRRAVTDLLARESG